MGDYTKPGYEAYARSVVEEIKPEVARDFRVFDSPRETAVIGSSLGGVVSFYMAWQYPPSSATRPACRARSPTRTT